MSLKARVIATNKLLSDIYQQDMRLSSLLLKLGFNNEEISFVGDKLLFDTAIFFLETLEETIIDFQDGTRKFEIIQGSYGLTGDSSQTLRQLAEKLNISHERVRQLKEKTLKGLQSVNQQSKLELLFKKKIQQSIKVYQKQLSNIDRSASKYNFALSSLSNGERCLTISEGNEQIIIAESNFIDFCNQLATVRSKWGINYSVAEVRKRHKKAYAKWTQEEEELLINNFVEGLSVEEIATMLERKPGAIASRINKLGLNN